MNKDIEEQINKYIELLVENNKKHNLIGNINNIYDVLIKDVVDISKVIEDSGYIVDFGSGNGSVAIPLAIKLKSTKIIAIEANKKKTIFINKVKNNLELSNLCIIRGRIEQIFKDKSIKRIIMRACLEMDDAIKLCRILLINKGYLYIFSTKELNIGEIYDEMYVEGRINIEKGYLYIIKNVSRETLK